MLILVYLCLFVQVGLAFVGITSRIRPFGGIITFATSGDETGPWGSMAVSLEEDHVEITNGFDEEVGIYASHVHEASTTASTADPSQQQGEEDMEDIECIDDLFDALSNDGGFGTEGEASYAPPTQRMHTSAALTEIRCYATRQLALLCRSVAKNVDKQYKTRFGSTSKPLQWRDVRRAYERPRNQRWSEDKREEAKRVFIKNSLLKILEKRNVHPRLLMQVLDIDWDRLGAEPAAIGLTIATEKSSVVIAVEEGSYTGMDAIRSTVGSLRNEDYDGDSDTGTDCDVHDDDNEGGFGQMTFPPVDIPTFLATRWNLCLAEATAEGILSDRLLMLFDDLEEILLSSSRLVRDLDRVYGARPSGRRSRDGQNSGPGQGQGRGSGGRSDGSGRRRGGPVRKWRSSKMSVGAGASGRRVSDQKGSRRHGGRRDPDQGPAPKGPTEVDLTWMFDTIAAEECRNTNDT